MPTNQTIIIGSGMAGLHAGALLQAEGVQVTLLEAAAEWGGCAGKFQRGKFRFPVGATLGIGFEDNGIHRRVLNYLGADLSVISLQQAMTVRIGGEDFPYFTNREQFLAMWAEKEPETFPQIAAFFDEAWQIASALRKYMSHYAVLFPRTAYEWQALFNGFNIRSLKLAPYINKTMKTLVDKHGLADTDSFIHFINGTLLDSMQTTYEHVHLLLGATALNVYHEGAYYVEGGLYRLAEELVESIKINGGTVKKPSRVVAVARGNERRWSVKDHRGRHWEADNVVFNTGINNAADLLPSAHRDKLSKKFIRHSVPEKQWGAATMYAAVKEDVIPPDAALFYQVLVDPAQPAEEENHFFVSLSAHKDLKRAPEGFRTITVSSHIRIENWQSQYAYDDKKAKFIAAVKRELETLFPGFNQAAVHFESGGPVAWERFVLRKSGTVGGLPQTRENALWNAVSHREIGSGLWLCGDTVYPGAGTIGAASSGVHVARSISGKKIL
ncbi:phytoene desaturase family protein [Salisediminibacterium halotolerans]|uniref:C-3',4' desaturase CrtD n=1 Tax=Salisediminibacterium halotolerans TaxID=517425 RepID=A0A1H9WSS0_9BACI|nr:FAD-dependent oxidoreductase [Salisediminibacterium haloalkalitolerans]SES36864.1 C-3',4' desaturase CrtD [Salisediminibacterium haloalkalitolerans]